MKEEYEKILSKTSISLYASLSIITFGVLAFTAYNFLTNPEMNDMVTVSRGSILAAFSGFVFVIMTFAGLIALLLYKNNKTINNTEATVYE